MYIQMAFRVFNLDQPQRVPAAVFYSPGLDRLSVAERDIFNQHEQFLGAAVVPDIPRELVLPAPVERIGNRLRPAQHRHRLRLIAAHIAVAL
ncbi:hypothetical protein D3C85_1662220 [compost metagenome]